jgi:hypothetical protein
MLDISTMTDEINPILKDLVTQFRRIQVSRFPLIVRNSGHSVTFVDSRFVNEDRWQERVVAELFIDKSDDKQMLVLESKLIVNQRFTATRKHQKQTKDTKKMLKYLQTYVRPFTPKQIADRTFRKAENAFDSWKWNVRQNASSVIGLSMHEVYEELKRMRDLGLKAQTAAFQKAMDEGIERYEESQEVKDREAKKTMAHIFFNSDESVSVNWEHSAELLQDYENVDAMPYEVASKIAMLRISDADKLVPSVGMKVDDRTFWVDMGV